MRSNDYHFITTWRVQSTCEEISAILGDGPGLVRWWPSVYLDAREIEPGDKTGVGKVISLYTKGWLPYTLRWQFRITHNRHPHGFALEAWGDFVGRGVWTFADEPPAVNAAPEAGNTRRVTITYDWRVAAEKPLLRYFSFIMKPIFSANHHWAMAMGEESLKLELARRRALHEAERALIPPPPPPTFRFLLPRGGRAIPALLPR